MRLRLKTSLVRHENSNDNIRISKVSPQGVRVLRHYLSPIAEGCDNNEMGFQGTCQDGESLQLTVAEIRPFGFHLANEEQAVMDANQIKLSGDRAIAGGKQVDTRLCDKKRPCVEAEVSKCDEHRNASMMRNPLL
jgi:hypothetical protein